MCIRKEPLWFGAVNAQSGALLQLVECLNNAFPFLFDLLDELAELFGGAEAAVLEYVVPHDGAGSGGHPGGTSGRGEDGSIPAGAGGVSGGG